MRSYSETLGLPNSAFTLLRDLIHERTGLFYSNGNKTLMADRLSPLVIERGFDSVLDYYYLLKYDTQAEQEWKRVIDALSIQETYFWREMDQINALTDVIVPEFFSTPRIEPLRIWSAACATGEEPLTIAMALNEKNWFNRVPIEIYASDASNAAVEKAKQGIYRKRSFRSLPPALFEKYFVARDGAREETWKITPEISSRVKWTKANLVEKSDVELLAIAPIIFCRNVFIYFSESAIRKTLSLFNNYMPRPGFLFVAASESLLKLTTDFQLREVGGAFLYMK
jgi:chemotaxis protein methyltransferase CheR